MNPFSHFGNFLDALNPGNSVHYERKAPTFIPMKVPGEYQDSVLKGASHAGLDPQKFAGQINAENGGNWSPTLKGWMDPTDHGVTQMNPLAENIITGRTGPKVNYFKNNYGKEYDRENPQHQILGMSVYMNWLRQFGLPGAGVKTPSNQAVQTSYNTGAQGYARSKSGDKEAIARTRRYEDLLRSRGASSTD